MRLFTIDCFAWSESSSRRLAVKLSIFVLAFSKLANVVHAEVVEMLGTRAIHAISTLCMWRVLGLAGRHASREDLTSPVLLFLLVSTLKQAHDIA